MAQVFGPSITRVALPCLSSLWMRSPVFISCSRWCTIGHLTSVAEKMTKKVGKRAMLAIIDSGFHCFWRFQQLLLPRYDMYRSSRSVNCSVVPFANSSYVTALTSWSVLRKTVEELRACSLCHFEEHETAELRMTWKSTIDELRKVCHNIWYGWSGM